MASFSSAMEKYRLATYDSSCPDTPGMCLAASYGPTPAERGFAHLK